MNADESSNARDNARIQHEHEQFLNIQYKRLRQPLI